MGLVTKIPLSQVVIGPGSHKVSESFEKKSKLSSLREGRGTLWEIK